MILDHSLANKLKHVTVERNTFDNNICLW